MTGMLRSFLRSIPVLKHHHPGVHGQRVQILGPGVLHADTAVGNGLSQRVVVGAAGGPGEPGMERIAAVKPRDGTAPVAAVIPAGLVIADGIAARRRGAGIGP